jgi:hypothetical protein
LKLNFSISENENNSILPTPLQEVFPENVNIYKLPLNFDAPIGLYEDSSESDKLCSQEDESENSYEDSVSSDEKTAFVYEGAETVSSSEESEVEESEESESEESKIVKIWIMKMAKK